MKKLGSRTLPPSQEIPWNLARKHSCQSADAEALYPWDIDGDTYLEYLAVGTSRLSAFSHDLTPLWTSPVSPGITYVDFRPTDERKLIFAYGHAKYLLDRSVWIDTAGKVVAEAEYARDLGRRALSKKSDALEFTYGRSGDNEVVATRRNVSLRDRQGKNVWSYPLSGVPEQKAVRADCGQPPRPCRTCALLTSMGTAEMSSW